MEPRALVEELRRVEVEVAEVGEEEGACWEDGGLCGKGLEQLDGRGGRAWCEMGDQSRGGGDGWGRLDESTDLGSGLTDEMVGEDLERAKSGQADERALD